MSWTAFEYESRKKIGTYPDEMTMSEHLRKSYAEGFRLVVENDDGREFEAFIDSGTLRIVSDPPLAEEENDDAYDDENYTPSD